MSAAPSSFLHQPKAVWATAFACVVGFMSIGLVDPILTSIASGLNASASQVSLLFTSYFLVTSLMMLVTGFVSSRLGGRKTLLLGSGLIVLFAALAGTSDSVAELVGFRAGWGLGNAFFVVTALSVIVASASGGTMAAILLYESALGLGLSVGPLLGAALGEHSWRYPFFGTATLMAIGFVAIWLWLPEQAKPAQKTSLSAPLKALSHGGLRTTATSAFFYNLAFFTILAFTPFVLDMPARSVGLIFFGWGILLAIFSVLVAPRLQARFSAVQILSGSMTGLALLLAVMTVAVLTGAPKSWLAACVVLSGAVSGIANTVYTELALEVSDSPRPVASAGYNFVRWFAGVLAPWLAPELAQALGAEAAFAVAAIAALAAAGLLIARRRSLAIHHAGALTPAPVRPVMVALAGTLDDAALVLRGAQLAQLYQAPLELLHARTWETVAGQAQETESAARAHAVLEFARSQVLPEVTDVTTTLLETPASHLASTLLDALRNRQPQTLVIGHRSDQRFAHIQHTELAELLARFRLPCELLMVSAAQGAHGSALIDQTSDKTSKRAQVTA
ncbi:MFS transporter [Thalassolituus sp. LLYu03]|uniref:MFS transporter n=1 Tax=Thalassolituus sp. LLYu03 TaxID=3421656 RepID=UPI003D2944A6